MKGLKERIGVQREAEQNPKKRSYYEAMDISLDAVLVIARRYADLAEEKAAASEGKDKERFRLMADTLRKVPENGAENLYEAIQSFILMWQVMCLEQTPNPYAFFCRKCRPDFLNRTVRWKIRTGIWRRPF